MTVDSLTQALKLSEGTALPLGTSLKHEAVNYAVYAKGVQEVILHIFQEEKPSPIASIPLTNRTGDVYHVAVHNAPVPHSYLFDIVRDGETINSLIPPQATALKVPRSWNSSEPYQPRGLLLDSQSFDWEGVSAPNLTMEELVIYEMHVRGFTQGLDIEHAGTFLGVIERIPYFKELGINAVELLPVYEFNESEWHIPHPETGKPLCNYWGYSPVSFFAPMARYASATSKLSVADQFRTMVRELHRNGIEVILDVVYNHTAERVPEGIVYSLAGWDPEGYYMHDSKGKALDYSGCGNTLDCNQPIVRELIIDSLRHWVSEMGVDGFRFDLASILTRDQDGTPMEHPPLVDAISRDPILSASKLIAEPWDIGGLYQVGGFFSHTPRWSEWNGKFRDCTRRFLKGNPDLTGEFARRISGSEDLYGDNRKPSHSINFITAHDGFSLHDLVSYNKKHNLINGEENRDGNNQNDSWNCGTEGLTSNTEIISLRQRQMRNLHLALMISQGVPMVHMGDEYGHSKQGNNNTWCQDNTLNWLQWEQISENAGFFRFFQGLIQFRNRSELLHRACFLQPDDVVWHGTQPQHPNWASDCRLVAFTLCDKEEQHDIYAAFSPQASKKILTLPLAPEGKAWHRIVDTALDSPNDFCDEEQAPRCQSLQYELQPFSAILLRAQST